MYTVYARIFVVFFGVLFFAVSANAQTLEEEVINGVQKNPNAKIQRLTEQLDVFKQELFKEWTLQLKGLASKERRLSGDKKKPVLDQMRRLAKQRRQLLKEIAAKNPAVVITNELTNQTNFPVDIKNELEQEITEEGTLRVLHTHGLEKDASQDFLFLETRNGKKYALHFRDTEPLLMGNSKVKVSGIALDNRLVVASTTKDFEIINAAQPGHTVKKVAVILFNFQDATSTPVTPEFMRQLVFTSAPGKIPQPYSTNAYYQESSFGQLVLEGKLQATGDVFGWYTLAQNSSASCNFGAWTTAARSAAVAAGVNLSGYDHFIYVFPLRPVCNWSGQAEIGGDETWLTGISPTNFSHQLVTHELGHNFGLHHALQYHCVNALGQRVTLSNSCTLANYGDPFDPMGYGQGHMSTYHKGRLNWYQPQNIVTATTSDIYTLEPIETASSGIKALRIFRDSTRYYYLEYRQPYGFDTYPSTHPVTNGVSVRFAPLDGVLNRTWLLDMTPGSVPIASLDFEDSALLAGQTFTDTEKGISIKTLSVSPTSAQVEITVAADTQPPVIELISPLHNTIASGIVHIIASTTDNNGIGGVQFQINGVNAGPKVAVAPYFFAWNTRQVATGSPMTLTAIAEDGVGNTTTSSPITVIVNNAPRGPIAHWTFEDVVSNAAVDVSGNNNALVLQNTNGATDLVPGRIGKALNFDGVNNYGIVDNLTGGNWRGNFTVALWAKPTVTGQLASTTFFANSNSFSLASSSPASSQIDLDGTAPGKFRLYNGTPVSGKGLVSTNWQQLVVSFESLSPSGIQYRVYTDGLSKGGVAFGAIGDQYNLFTDYILGTNREGTRYFNGLIDDVRVYNRALTAAEVTALFSAASTTDAVAPVISSGLPSGTLPAGTASTTLSVTTNEPAVCRYATTPTLPYATMTNLFAINPATTTMHTASITGLQSGSYAYYVKCQDHAGNATINDSLISFLIP